MHVKVLNYLMFLMRKQTSIVKGCGYADGRMQKASLKKENAEAPKVALDAILLSSLQDSTER